MRMPRHRQSTSATALLQQGFGLAMRMEDRAYTAAARQKALETQARMLTAQPSGVLGDGRLATLTDVDSLGMLSPNGLFLGAMDGQPLFACGEGHLLTYARTGAGKGRDLILPNLAHVANRSLVVVDVKDGENCFASVQHRFHRLGQNCVFLNPFGLLGLPDTRINPLQGLVDIIAAGEQIDTQADEIAQILLPPNPKDAGSAWVRKGALRLLSTTMEYLAICDPPNCTLGGLWRCFNAAEERLRDLFQMMTTCGIDGVAGRAASLYDTMMEAPKQWQAYLSDVIEALVPFEPGKSLARCTNGHDFDFGTLKARPHTVYLMLPSEKIGVAAPWMSLILNHAIEAMARTTGPVPCTILADEFPQLPPAPAIMKALRLYRGKGIQLWLFAQGRYSMEGRWSREAVKEFEDQAAILTTTAVEDPSLMQDIERWSGYRTVLMRNVNHNGGAVEAASASLSESKRPVLQSEDIRAIGQGQQIIRIAGFPHLVVCARRPYFTVHPWQQYLRDVRTLHQGARL